LGGDEWGVAVGKSQDLHRVSKGPIERVGEGGREWRSQQIDVELQIPRGVEAVHGEGSAAAVGGTHQVQNDGPHRRSVEHSRRTRLIPAEGVSALACGRWIRCLVGNQFSREQFELQFEAVKVVAAEGSSEDATNLIEMACDLQF